jgi:hypothetical protein
VDRGNSTFLECGGKHSSDTALDRLELITDPKRRRRVALPAHLVESPGTTPQFAREGHENPSDWT